MWDSFLEAFKNFYFFGETFFLVGGGGGGVARGKSVSGETTRQNF